MTEPTPTPRKPKLIDANFSDEDAAMSRRIFFGFMALAGVLLSMLAIPGIKTLLEKMNG